MTELTESTRKLAVKLGVPYTKTIEHHFPEGVEEDGYSFYLSTEPEEITVSNLIEFLEKFKDRLPNGQIILCDDNFPHLILYDSIEMSEEQVQALIVKKQKSKEKNKILAIKRKEKQILLAAKQAEKLEAKLAALKKKAGLA